MAASGEKKREVARKPADPVRILLALVVLGCLLPAGLQGQSSESLTNQPGPVSLSEAVQVALKNNPTIKASAAYADAVRQEITIARASRFPRLDFSESFTRGNNPVYVFGTLLTQRQFTSDDFALNALNRPLPVNNFETRFSGSMPIYDAGETSRRVDDAKLANRIAGKQQVRTEQEVVFQVIRAYTSALLAKERLQVAKSAVDAAESGLKDAQARQEQGMAVPSDVLSAQAQLANAQEQFLTAKNAASISKVALAVAMGLRGAARAEVEGGLAQPGFDAGSLDEREQRALKLRPDYLATQLGSQRARNGARLARGEFQPKLNVSGAWALDNQNFASRGGNNWAAGATLSFNLFDGGARFARLSEAHARERQAAALEEQMNAAVRLQVEEAYLNLSSARDRMAVTRDAASQAKESLRILENRYAASLASMTSVLQAETAATQAETNHLNAVYDYRLSYAALELATGELSADSPAVVR